jgi:hypothetical protein
LPLKPREFTVDYKVLESDDDEDDGNGDSVGDDGGGGGGGGSGDAINDYVKARARKKKTNAGKAGGYDIKDPFVDDDDFIDDDDAAEPVRGGFHGMWCNCM